MNTQSNTVPESRLEAESVVPRAMSATRPFYWSVRRELWENRSIYLAPALVAAVVLLGFLISAPRLAERRRAILLLDVAHLRAAIGKPYDIVAMLLFLTAFTVGFFYCLDALYGERRERSILFWKSLPVSDLTAVLAKVTIPLVVLPLVVFVIALATQLVMLVLGTVILRMNGLGAAPGTQWSPWPETLILLYGLVTLALWHAPLFGWLLLVSSWAPRVPFLWAVLPPLAIAVLEKHALGTGQFALLLKYRLIGHTTEAFTFDAQGTIDSLDQLTPGHFFSTPGLWLGLVFAAAFLAGAVRLRRQGGPI